MELLVPWHTAKEASRLDAQLAKELPSGHALVGIPVHAVAERQDCDDVLFQLLDGSGRMVVVHLTYSVNVSPAWPTTEFFQNFSAWVEERMHPDHIDFNA
jgi:hypothetical protein